MTNRPHNHPLPILDARPAPPDAPRFDHDPAARSLSEALRLCFTALKALILILLIAFILSGLFNVHPQEAAVRLRFGKVVGPPGQQVFEAGGPYFALPYPFEQVVRVPTAPQQIELNRQFWFELPPAEQDPAAAPKAPKPGPLNPEKDGSLLSGDTNILHARWTVTFTVTDPLAYAARVPDHKTALKLIRAAAEEGIVLAAAQTPADQLIRAQDTPLAKTFAQRALDAHQPGITINALRIKDPIFPLSVQRSVQQVLDAEAEKTKLIEEAQQHWQTTLGQTAGQAYRPLMDLIARYEHLSSSPQRPPSANPDEAVQLLAHLDHAFDELAIEHNGQTLAIGGEVAQILHEAHAYRSEVVARIRGEAQYFQSLLPQYRANPAILVSRLWQDAQQQILTGDIETLYLPPGQVQLELNRDPAVRTERERKQLSSQGTANQEADTH